jgi:hypothetical protein
MVDEHDSTRLLASALILIVFTAATVSTLHTIFKASKPYQLKLFPERLLTNGVFCPKCCSSSGLEPTGYNAVRCKNCGFVFSFGGGTLYDSER